MKASRLSEYRVMWVFVFFDLPTYTALELPQAFAKVFSRMAFRCFNTLSTCAIVRVQRMQLCMYDE